jgi:hypothetical protein
VSSVVLSQPVKKERASKADAVVKNRCVFMFAS